APNARATRTPERTDTAWARAPRLSRGRALFFFDGPLTIDAVAGEGQRLEALVRDRLAAALAVSVAALVELLQRGHNLLQEPLGAVAELEQEFPVIGRRGLVSEIFG